MYLVTAGNYAASARDIEMVFHHGARATQGNSDRNTYAHIVRDRPRGDTWPIVLGYLSIYSTAPHGVIFVPSGRTLRQRLLANPSGVVLFAQNVTASAIGVDPAVSTGIMHLAVCTSACAHGERGVARYGPHSTRIADGQRSSRNSHPMRVVRTSLRIQNSHFADHVLHLVQR